MNKLETLATMYRKNEITEYVMERELSKCLGERATIKIIDKASTNRGKSFCIFPLPEKLIEGFHITYFIDKETIKTYYTPHEFELVMEKVRKMEQRILAEYNRFSVESSAVTYGKALGNFLHIYDIFKEALDIRDDIQFLPERAELADAIEKFKDETYEISDIETLLVKNIVCKEILQYIKRYVKEADIDIEGGKIYIVKNAFDIPRVNLGQQEIMKHCTSTFGIRNHKDIPHDYNPSTNQ